MSITRWDPFDEVTTLRRSMERMFDDFLTPRRTRTGGSEAAWWQPPVEMFETKTTR